MNISKAIILFLIISIFNSCSNISVLNQKRPQELYSPEFLKRLTTARVYLNKGNFALAQKTMSDDQGQTLSTVEKGMKRNFLGVIFFSTKNYEKALYNFNLAESYIDDDQVLIHQVYLNQSSCYFKLAKFEEAGDTHGRILFEALSPGERKKYGLLGIKIAEKQDDKELEFKSLLSYLSVHKQIPSLKSDRYFDRFMGRYSDLSYTEKTLELERYESAKPLALGYTAYKDIDKLYESGERDEAKDLLTYLKSNYSGYHDLDKFLKGHSFVAENFLKFNKDKVGVILPLTGKRAGFGKRALLGIDFALRSLNSDIELVVRDSKGSGAIGAYQVKELIEKHGVSYIVGGLFPDEATKQYRTTKKYGALYISLAQVFLDKSFKDKLLIEVAGSIESQVEALSSKEFIDQFGKNSAIMYSKNQKGEAYIDSFWDEFQSKSLSVSSVVSYSENLTDFRTPVKKMLGLAYPRMRQEELELMESIYSLKKKGNIRRVQTLGPQINFDWVFIPSFPRQ
ncbi:ABC transporter substrate-binding protein, partial [bacterium]|nr:ABC transporter substrate-binding protein [bacterium]